MNLPGSNVADGVEFEETFPEPHSEPASVTPPPSAAAPAPLRVASPPPARSDAPVAPAAPRLSIVRPEPAADESETVFQEQLERRMREAEALVKQTVERVRLDEEKRLTEWMQARREEEERRLARWADERRVTIEDSLDPRSTADQRSSTDRRSTRDRRSPTSDTFAPRVDRRTSGDEVVQRIEEMLREWQERFEQRQDQWRTELERALTRQFSIGERAVAPARAESSPLADAIASATSARDVSRLIHGALSVMTQTTAFAVSLHQEGREDVAYRYRVANDDEVGTLLRRDALEDGAQSAAAHADGWVRAQRVVRAGTRNVTVHTAQVAIRDGVRTVGVLTLQTEAAPVADGVLPRIAELVQLAAPRLAALRDAGSFRGA